MTITELLAYAREILEPGELPDTMPGPPAAIERALSVLYSNTLFDYTQFLETLLAAQGYCEENEIRGLCDGVGAAHEALNNDSEALRGYPPRRYYNEGTRAAAPDPKLDREAALSKAIKAIENSKTMDPDLKYRAAAALREGMRDQKMPRDLDMLRNTDWGREHLAIGTYTREADKK